MLVQAVMEAEVTSKIGAGLDERSPERLTHRNGYRDRPGDTRVGTLDLKIPKVREGSYSPRTGPGSGRAVFGRLNRTSGWSLRTRQPSTSTATTPGASWRSM